MPEIIFPDKWWKLSQEEYFEAKTTLKALINKDDGGNAEVMRREEKGRVGETYKDAVFFSVSNYAS